MCVRLSLCCMTSGKSFPVSGPFCPSSEKQGCLKILELKAAAATPCLGPGDQESQEGRRGEAQSLGLCLSPAGSGHCL